MVRYKLKVSLWCLSFLIRIKKVFMKLEENVLLFWVTKPFALSRLFPMKELFMQIYSYYDP